LSPVGQKAFNFKASLVLGLAFFFYFGCQSRIPVWHNAYKPIQNTKKEKVIYANEELDSVISNPTSNPGFPGGMTAWMTYLQKNITYPETARIRQIEGSVFLSFHVKYNGEIKNIVVNRGIGHGCDEEAVRLLLNSGLWNPGIFKDQAVNSTSNMRIVFKIE